MPDTHTKKEEASGIMYSTKKRVQNKRKKKVTEKLLKSKHIKRMINLSKFCHSVFYRLLVVCKFKEPGSVCVHVQYVPVKILFKPQKRE